MLEGVKLVILQSPILTNLTALFLSMLSMLGLVSFYKILAQYVGTFLISTVKEECSENLKKAFLFGVLIACVWISVSLPPTFSSLENSREVMVFWHDEGITLDQVYTFVKGEYAVPVYRFTQGWITFLPIALICKLINQVVPVSMAMVNILLRFYQLGALFFAIVMTYLLIYRFSKSYSISLCVVLISFSRPELFPIFLAIDRPDTFQLLFILLSLHSLYSFYRERTEKSWFFSILFCAIAFGTKYAGHLLVPVIALIWLIKWLEDYKPELKPKSKHILRGISWLVASIICIFPMGFIMLNPYHLININAVISMFSTYLPIYVKGNVYNLPEFNAPSHLVLWWNVFASRYQFDYWLMIASLIGTGLVLIGFFVKKEKDDSVKNLILLSWGIIYCSFLVIQYGLSDYRYILPVIFIIPYLSFVPFILIYKCMLNARVLMSKKRIVSLVVSLALIAGTIYGVYPRINDSFKILASFRNPNIPAFDVGYYLDRVVPLDEDPKILMTNLVYIPPRFTDITVHNVDVTLEFIKKNKFDYIIMSDNMYDIYANKPVEGYEKVYDELYKVYYVDVVRVYTQFKNHTCEGYKSIASFGNFEVFVSLDYLNENESKKEVEQDWINANLWTIESQGASINYFQRYLKIDTNQYYPSYQVSFPIKDMIMNSRYRIRGKIEFEDLNSHGVTLGILDNTRQKFSVIKSIKTNNTTFDIQFYPDSDMVYFVVLNSSPVKQSFKITDIELYSYHRGSN